VARTGYASQALQSEAEFRFRFEPEFRFRFEPEFSVEAEFGFEMKRRVRRFAARCESRLFRPVKPYCAGTFQICNK
jgi:hypothetical protein